MSDLGELSNLLNGASQGADLAAQKILGMVSQDDVDTIAEDDHERNATRYAVADNSVARKLLANDTFNDIKHYLRGKIGGLVDAAWQIQSLRKPLRDMANAAAQKIIP